MTGMPDALHLAGHVQSTSGIGTMVTIASSVVIHPKDGDPTQYGDQGQRS